MSPQNLVRLGPFTLRADDDADVIRALEASGNKVGLVRACIRLAITANVVELEAVRRAQEIIGDAAWRVAADEWALIERARRPLDVKPPTS